MDLKIIDLAKNGGNMEDLRRVLEKIDSNIIHQITPVGNTLLHLAAKFGQKDFLEKVGQVCPALINMKNRDGDTVLHVAAIAGHLDVVKHLIEIRECCQSFELLRSQNHRGDTALHQALRYRRFDVARLLIQTEPRLCCLVNKASESPLFMAAMGGAYNTVEMVFHCCPSPAFEGPKGWTALHASVVSGCLKSYNVTKRLLEVKPELGRMVDIHGRSPLHYAVDMEKANIVSLLLKSDPSIAYIQDRDGWSPLHVAANNMSGDELDISILKDLINYCPDLEYLRDNKGNNFLHVLMARVENYTPDEDGDADELWWVLQTGVPLEELLNQPNNHGNTPLHLAVIYGKRRFRYHLMMDARVDETARNNNYLTADDIRCCKTSKSPAEAVELMVTNPKSIYAADLDGPSLWIETLKHDFEIMNKELVEYAERTAIQQRIEFEKQRIAAEKQIIAAEKQRIAAEKQRISAEEQRIAAKKQKIAANKEAISKKVVKTHTLVATLIATVAFAAAFQIPGGYNVDDNGVKKAGMAVLAGEGAFKAFVISDVMALSFSFATLLLHFFTEVFYADVTPKAKTLKASVVLILIAIVAMIAAFMFGVFAVLVRTHSMWIGILTLFFGPVVLLLGYYLSRKSHGSVEDEDEDEDEHEHEDEDDDDDETESRLFSLV